MTNKERLEIIKMDNERYHQEVVFSSQVLSDIKWLINRVEELEKQRNERTQLLNAEVAKNVRYEKVLDELWKTAKRALEDEE